MSLSRKEGTDCAAFVKRILGGHEVILSVQVITLPSAMLVISFLGSSFIDLS